MPFGSIKLNADATQKLYTFCIKNANFFTAQAGFY